MGICGSDFIGGGRVAERASIELIGQPLKSEVPVNQLNGFPGREAARKSPLQEQVDRSLLCTGRMQV
jgi:hypothetical protein